ncbi:MAG: OmpA family protein [Pseudomonadota bacterium]
MRNTMLWTIAVLSLAATHSAYAGDCTAAHKLFETGKQAGQRQQWAEARRALEKSVAECNRFDNWYLLGQTQLQLEDYNAASASFEDARRFAQSNDEKALAGARYAQVMAQQGKIDEPLAILHQARKAHTHPPAWMTELAMSLDKKRVNQPVTVAQLTRALTSRSVTLISPNAKPSVNITINFKYNSTEVTENSTANIDVLAEALAGDALYKGPVQLTGHTDARGETQYNKTLSEQRAQTIAAALIARKPELKSRLHIAGKGASEPLYPGESEDIFALNRRIEVTLE